MSERLVDRLKSRADVLHWSGNSDDADLCDDAARIIIALREENLRLQNEWDNCDEMLQAYRNREDGKPVIRRVALPPLVIES